MSQSLEKKKKKENRGREASPSVSSVAAINSATTSGLVARGDSAALVGRATTIISEAFQVDRATIGVGAKTESLDQKPAAGTKKRRMDNRTEMEVDAKTASASADALA